MISIIELYHNMLAHTNIRIGRAFAYFCLCTCVNLCAYVTAKYLLFFKCIGVTILANRYKGDSDVRTFDFELHQ